MDKAQSCCNNNCDQGDTCPHRKEVAINTAWDNFLYKIPFNFTLFEAFATTIVVITVFNYFYNKFF
jgi:hypothetical protein